MIVATYWLFAIITAGVMGWGLTIASNPVPRRRSRHAVMAGRVIAAMVTGALWPATFLVLLLTGAVNARNAKAKGEQ